MAGALVTKLLLLDEGKAVNYGAATVSEKFLQGKALSGLLCEIIGTFVLMWAIMGVAVNPRGERAWAGWVIGIALGRGVMVFAPLDGAGLQPRPLVRPGDRLGRVRRLLDLHHRPGDRSRARRVRLQGARARHARARAEAPIETLD